MPDNILFFATISSMISRLFLDNFLYSNTAAIKTQREIDFTRGYML